MEWITSKFSKQRPDYGPKLHVNTIQLQVHKCIEPFLSASQRLGASSSHFVVVVVVLVLVLVMFNFQTLEIIKYRAQIPPVSELEKI